jgi:hypothetical protein
MGGSGLAKLRPYEIGLRPYDYNEEIVEICKL